MALRTVHYVQPRSHRSEVATGVIMKEDTPGYLRDILCHLPIANTVDDLALHESCAEGVQSIQLALIEARSDGVAAGEVKRIREDDAEGRAEGGNHVHPGQVRRRAQVIKGGQDGIA